MAKRVRARGKRRTTSIDGLAAETQRELARASRVLQRQFTAGLEAGNVLERLGERVDRMTKATDGPLAKEVGDRTVLEEIAGLEGLIALYDDEIARILEDAAVRAYNVSGQNVLRSLGGSIRTSFELRNPAVLARLSRRANMLSGGVADSTWERMRETIRKTFYDERKGPEEVARALDRQFSELSRSRARTIARTETLVAVESATDDSFVRNGVEQKQWIAAVTSPTPPRPTHGIGGAHGQIVGVKEGFRVGSAILKHPGDPNGPLEEVINCRCDELAVIPAGQEPSDLWTGI